MRVHINHLLRSVPSTLIPLLKKYVLRHHRTSRSQEPTYQWRAHTAKPQHHADPREGQRPLIRIFLGEATAPRNSVKPHWGSEEKERKEYVFLKLFANLGSILDREVLYNQHHVETS